MAYAHRLQGSRYELKYVIPESLVRPLRGFLSAYLVPDEHADPENNWEYEVHSLYLDSPALELCRATVCGHKNRYKLRIRFYDVAGDSPVYFEIKRRVSEVILKQRAKVRRSVVKELLDGRWPQADHLANGHGDGAWGEELGALERFCQLRDRIGARGKVFVSYMREAHVTPSDNALRVTFDRAICGRAYRGAFDMARARAPVYPPIEGVVLELKFTDRFPVWMREMVRVFDLERRSMAKYVTCIQQLNTMPAELVGEYLDEYS